jgi:catechol 2,3-dioxygenase-like lactoylglutathione lyase family enzyme
MVIPVSDLDAAKAIYTALLGAPHTDQPYYVGYNVDGFEVALAPGDVAGGPVVNADVEDLDATLGRPNAAPRVKSHPKRGCACSPTQTATRSVCAASSNDPHGTRSPLPLS